MTIVGVIGGITALFAATIGLVQTRHQAGAWPIRRSASSAICFSAAGIGAYTAAIFHLMTHAFFKALLFLSAGSVIHALSGEQDIRKMGGLSSRFPGPIGCSLIGTIAIAGHPALRRILEQR